MDLSDFFSNIYGGFFELYDAVSADLSILWILAPVFILWVSTEIYYGQYSREKTSFSSIFTGAISLLWLSFITLRGLFAGGVGWRIETWDAAVWAVFIFTFYGLFVFYVSFRHILSENTLNVIASYRVLYFASFFLALFGIGGGDIGFYSVLAALIIFIFVSLLFGLIKKYWLAGFLGEVEAVKRAGKEKYERV